MTLEEFKAFNRFLNNVDDFVVAMRMFNMMHEPIGQGNYKLTSFGRTLSILIEKFMEDTVI